MGWLQHAFRPTSENALMWMSAAVPLSFTLWSALLNNYTYEQVSFTGIEIGALHTVREIPGFLAFSVAYALLWFKEQRLAYLSLILLAVFTGLTGAFGSFGWLLMVTFVSSIGFHYQVPIIQSLSLQWLSKERAPIVLGNMGAVSAFASLLALAIVVVAWKQFHLPYWLIYWLGAAASLAIVAWCWRNFPSFPALVPQRQEIILRKRYWLYYGLEFFSGARRQIFVVFAGWMLVERYGLRIHESTAILFASAFISMAAAPLAGRLIARFGERPVLLFEYLGLIVIFVSYAFVTKVEYAIALYMIDHLFFAFAIGMRTYFQKIADPADIAGSAGMAFTINHIAAVFLPIGLGLIWVQSNAVVFLIGAGFATGSALLCLLIPSNPEPGREIYFSLFRR